MDSQGQVLLTSDGQSPGNPDDQIDLHVPAGTDYLEVENLGGAAPRLDDLFDALHFTVSADSSFAGGPRQAPS